jgi:hypothetical protein
LNGKTNQLRYQHRQQHQQISIADKKRFHGDSEIRDQGSGIREKEPAIRTIS